MSVLKMAEGVSDYERPSWDEYFLKIKDAVGERSTCGRGRSGCVIVDDENHIISTGYVGAPAGLDHCDKVGHKFDYTRHGSRENEEKTHCVRTIHAEQNALIHAAKKGVSVNHGTLYCTMTPCQTCAMLIIQAGIRRVVCDKKYQAAEESIKMFEKVGIELVHMSEETMTYGEKNKI